MNLPGLFISLDGLDGAGKSLQCRLLVDWLLSQGRTVISCADPGGTAIGDLIRGILLDQRRQMAVTCEMFLFMSSRAQLTNEIIQPALAAGGIVVSDRYLLANVVYQGHAGGLDVETLWTIGRVATVGLEPNLTIVLDLPREVALLRRTRPADRMESREAEFHARVRQGFLTEAARRPDRIVVVNAHQPVDEVQAAIRAEVTRVLGAHSRS